MFWLVLGLGLGLGLVGLIGWLVAVFSGSCYRLGSTFVFFFFFFFLASLIEMLCSKTQFCSPSFSLERIPDVVTIFFPAGR